MPAIRRLFFWLDVDYDQWKALTLAALKLDVRQSMLVRSRSRAAATAHVAGNLLRQVIVYTAFGLFMAAVVWFGGDLQLVGVLLSTYILFIVGTAVLLDHNSAVTSPQDYPILGYRPITSRTYFAVRLTNVLVYTSAITTAAAWLPLGSLVLRHGPAVGLAGLVTVYGSSLFATLGILAGYALMLQWFGATRITRALSYVQLAMSFFIYGGYFFVIRGISDEAFTGLTMPASPWMFLYPGTWFAGFLSIAAGAGGPSARIGAGVGALSVGLLAVGMGRRLSLDYSARLGALTQASAERRSASARTGWLSGWFRGGEARAVAILVRSQFRNDQRFRLSVLSVLPLTLVYVLMGVRDGHLVDPFTRTPGQGRGFSFVTIAIVMFPSMLKLSLTRSDAFRASWIFFVCPADRARVIRATRDVLLVYFLLPYLIFIAAVYAWFIPNLLHVGVHILLMGLLSLLALQVQILVEPELPFARPPVKGREGGSLLVLMIVITAAAITLDALAPWIYGSLVATVVVFATLVALVLAVDRLTRARVMSQAQSLEFLG